MNQSNQRKFLIILSITVLYAISALYLVFGGWESIFGACNDAATCMKAHLSNPMLHRVLDHRCVIDISHTNSRRQVAFTHVPKCGGSTIHAFLKNALRSRYFSGPSHEPYQSSLDRSNNSLIYATIFREPMSRLFSEYQYMRDVMGHNRGGLPKNVRGDYAWNVAHDTNNITEWINNTHVREIISQQWEDYFISSYNKSIATKKHFVSKTYRRRYTPLIAFDSEVYLQYLNNIPEEYQCVNHLKIVIVLLQRYAVVGVLEQMHDFWEIAFRRLKLDQSLFVNATARHANKSKYTIPEEVKEKVRKVMQPYLYCQSVVWNIAKMISDQDKQCVANIQV